MVAIHRVLDTEPVRTLDAYERSGGGTGIKRVLRDGPDAALAEVAASGLRGRGGAGFPTATKWQSVLDNLSAELPATVVINAAEGEPGTFKDRSIIRANPYRVLEGAMIAALTIGADEVVVATKQRFTTEVGRLRSAAAEITEAGWAPRISIDVVEGPEEYLYGEETALLEVVAGRLPFPRIAPPWRRGVDDAGDDSALAAQAEMAVSGQETPAAPALVNNVETMANVALIMQHGHDWFREVGTERSPGTIVCTVTGHTRRDGVREVAMGTPLREVIDAVGGRPRRGDITAVMSGVSNPLLPPELLDTPLTYEAMKEVGAGLGTGGFIVFDASVDPVSIAHGVSRFLFVESCGQCVPCKQDGRVIAESLDRLRTNQVVGDELAVLQKRLTTVDTGARCFLATQHQLVVQSTLALFPDAFQAHADGRAAPSDPELIAELVDIERRADRPGAVYDEHHGTKQPDWTYNAEDSGDAPSDWLDQRQGEGEAAVESGEII